MGYLCRYACTASGPSPNTRRWPGATVNACRSECFCKCPSWVKKRPNQKRISKFWWWCFHVLILEKSATSQNIYGVSGFQSHNALRNATHLNLSCCGLLISLSSTVYYIYIFPISVRLQMDIYWLLFIQILKMNSQLPTLLLLRNQNPVNGVNRLLSQPWW